ncbi:hypothetical protein HYV49_05765 [Candidatus Pacearchaeota archaeon]|nr:hypothetical protein [Candidatus Pacearchaeota archaeon]
MGLTEIVKSVSKGVWKSAKTAKLPRLAAYISAPAFLAHGAEAAQKMAPSIEKAVDVNWFDKLSGNLFYCFLDLNEKLGITALNTLDAVQEMDKWKTLGEYGMGVALFGWGAKLMKDYVTDKIFKKSEFFKPHKIREGFEALMYGATALAIHALSKYPAAEAAKRVSLEDIKETLSKLPEVHYGMTDQLASGDSKIIAGVIASYLLGAGYKGIRATGLL